MEKVQRTCHEERNYSTLNYIQHVWTCQIEFILFVSIPGLFYIHSGLNPDLNCLDQFWQSPTQFSTQGYLGTNIPVLAEAHCTTARGGGMEKCPCNAFGNGLRPALAALSWTGLAGAVVWRPVGGPGGIGITGRSLHQSQPATINSKGHCEKDGDGPWWGQRLNKHRDWRNGAKLAGKRRAENYHDEDELQKVVLAMNAGTGNGNQSEVNSNNGNKDETDNTIDPKATPLFHVKTEFVTKTPMCIHYQRVLSELCKLCKGVYFCSQMTVGRRCKKNGWSHACLCPTWHLYSG
jgi:hypothetical protein